MSAAFNPEAVLAGFSDPVLESQRVFRVVLDAMARPGSIHTMPLSPPSPAPLGPAAAALCLALLDFETRVWLQPQVADRALVDYLRFHCGCRIAKNTLEAQFALIADPTVLPPLEAFNPGDPEYPDRAATLVIQVERVSSAGGVTLTGPGIEGAVQLAVPALPADFWVQRIDSQARYPLGVDLVFVTGSRLVALPRSTQVKV